jgi:hypothetical protein
VACDLVGFFRPRLQDCPTKHYSSAAGKALPAISLGIAARVGMVGLQRLAVPCLLIRGEPTETSETALQLRLQISAVANFAPATTYCISRRNFFGGKQLRLL